MPVCRWTERDEIEASFNTGIRMVRIRKDLISPFSNAIFSPEYIQEPPKTGLGYMLGFDGFAGLLSMLYGKI